MKRVLVVDDKEDNLYYLRALLEGHGWAVETARHGAEALVKARQHPPDLVVSDLLMPVMDGYTLLRQWKADPRLTPLPFVVYTATYTEPADERLALSLGASAFILKPSEPEDFLARIAQVLAAPVASGPARVPTGDHDERLALYSETLIRKLEEKTLQLETANRALEEDVAARERAEAALRRREELLRIAGRTARLGGWSLEVPEMRLSWSDEVCAIHEVPSGTVPTREEAMAFCAPEFRDVARAELDACALLGTPFDVEIQLITAKGRRIWVRTIGRAERDAHGKIVCVQAALQDIDDRRKLEDQLRQAQKMEAIGKLAGGVAHDFNNLLTVILSYTTLMLDDLEEGNPLRADVREIQRAGERANDLTRQLLAFSRKQVLRPVALDVSQVAFGLEKILKRVLGEDIVLTLLSGAALHRVHADPTQVEQILMNLVVNARDAMPRGGKLTIETTNAELDASYAASHPGVIPGAYVLMKITDTGTGMDDATRERIFEPFFTTKETGKGTGLGLPTVLGIVEQSRGHIRVDSCPGRGTTFYVYLPQSEEEAASAAGRPPATDLRGTETILLVEDEDQVRVVTRSILRRHGYEVLDAQNSGDAFLLCEKHVGAIDLLLTDVVMPGMSGRELAERLAKMKPEMRVLFVSGYTEAVTGEHGVLESGVEFLQKPLTPETLLRKVRAVLDAAR